MPYKLSFFLFFLCSKVSTLHLHRLVTPCTPPFLRPWWDAARRTLLSLGEQLLPFPQKHMRKQTYFTSCRQNPTLPAPSSSGPWWFHSGIKRNSKQDTNLSSFRPSPEQVSILLFLLGSELFKNADSPRLERGKSPQELRTLLQSQPTT